MQRPWRWPLAAATTPHMPKNRGEEMTMRALVAYGTKYGATAEIARRIGEAPDRGGFQPDVKAADDAGDPGSHGAVVLGSAVYIGRWRKPAVKYLKTFEAALAERPVWLFSSGPTGRGDLGELAQGRRFPKGLQPIADRIRLRDSGAPEPRREQHQNRVELQAADHHREA